MCQMSESTVINDFDIIKFVTARNSNNIILFRGRSLVYKYTGICSDNQINITMFIYI